MTPSTRSTTSEKFTDDEKYKAIQFFSRLTTIYGRSKLKVLWTSEEQLQRMQREWATRIGKLSQEEFERIWIRLKCLLEQGHPDYVWPDVPRIIALSRGSDGGQYAAHKVFTAGLPQPEWRQRQIRECGKLASRTITAVLAGRACFVEDRVLHKG